ncbi:RNA polymerase sigma factor [Mumia zhuanghuii]|uniref:Sigma-70 family RNA polymerase sigma factor n=1 Tax=Mumia zhuanghuii TaxID=2585211 RepID=A0A5C4N0U3_9ACTN|nr:sigma-70 family RNA polymerase sigma factor [Mumia zhuanghuii]TNC51373.1 sigma-70 family RNA polymerase sigma factor [Mumia zhuanghuii]
MNLSDPVELAFSLRLARRDETALEEAYERYAPVVLAYVTRYVGRDEAEDVLQRTFLDVWRGASRYDPSQRFAGWLFTIAHHRAIDALRARRHVVVDVDAIHDLVGEDGRETMNRFADAADVRWAVARLPEHERTVLEMAYFHDLTQPEIAAHLRVPLGTVKARAARGTRRLGRILSDADPQG